jgi:hypothetical protein
VDRANLKYIFLRSLCYSPPLFLIAIIFLGNYRIYILVLIVTLIFISSLFRCEACGSSIVINGFMFDRSGKLVCRHCNNSSGEEGHN